MPKNAIVIISFLLLNRNGSTPIDSMNRLGTSVMLTKGLRKDCKSVEES